MHRLLESSCDGVRELLAQLHDLLTLRVQHRLEPLRRLSQRGRRLGERQERGERSGRRERGRLDRRWLERVEGDWCAGVSACCRSGLCWCRRCCWRCCCCRRCCRLRCCCCGGALPWREVCCAATDEATAG